MKRFPIYLFLSTIVLLETVTVPRMPLGLAIPITGNRWMQVIVSLAVVGASMFIILAKRYAPRDKHWAYATVGTILGFWLFK